jgi:hypothetical protein
MVCPISTAPAVSHEGLRLFTIPLLLMGIPIPPVKQNSHLSGIGFHIPRPRSGLVN